MNQNLEELNEKDKVISLLEAGKLSNFYFFSYTYFIFNYLIKILIYIFVKLCLICTTVCLEYLVSN